MKRTRRGLGPLVAVAGWLACAGSVLAEEQGTKDFGRPGFYGGVGFIYAPSAFNLDDAEKMLPPTPLAGNSLDGNNAWGLDARIGYRTCSRFAVEADYHFIPGFDVERGGDGTVLDLRTQTATVNGKLFLLVDTFQPYVLLGAGFLHSNADGRLSGFSANGTGFAGRVGAGADYYLRRNVVLNVEFSSVLPTGHVSDVMILPLVFGAQYRF